MKKIIFSLGFAALALGATAQVKIKDGSVTGSSTTPNSNAILELESSQRGLLYPRVALTSTSSASPLTAHVKGMVVYDTATVAANGITPGLYYNNGTQWVRFVDTAAWSLKGNAGTTAGTNFIGTTDNQDIVFKRNNVQAGWLNNANGNTAFGVNSLPITTTGIQNTAIGFDALGNNLTGTNNIGIGYLAFQQLNGGNNNIALGIGAAASQTAGNNNIAIGANQGFISTTGSNQLNIGGVIFGTGLPANGGTGGGNIMVNAGTPATVASTISGSTAAQQLATFTVSGGDANINGLIVGRGGGQTASNVAVGNQALYNNTSGAQNTAIGFNALVSNQTGTNNIGIGYLALQQINGGNNNIALGVGSAASQTAGNNNIAIGANQGFISPTGSNQLNIGGVIFGTGLPANGGTGGGSIGINLTNPSYTLHVNGSVAGTSAYNNLSDARYKQDIQPLANSLDKVLQLQGITFNWNRPYAKAHGLNVDSLNHIGFLAQEVEKIFPQVVTTGKDENHTKAVSYSDLVPVLAEAIKEQQKEIEALKKEIQELKK